MNEEEIDTDKYGMTNEELLERFSNLSVDDYKDLLAEVKRLRDEISRLNKWADNVREYFGDEAMMDLYDIYGGEEE